VDGTLAKTQYKKVNYLLE